MALPPIGIDFANGGGKVEIQSGQRARRERSGKEAPARTGGGKGYAKQAPRLLWSFHCAEERPAIARAAHGNHSRP